MAIDMSQFYQVFFEEAAEHLASMEALLLAIDPAAPDTEEVNALFRAAHSIKGSSGTFGFQDMMEVTHILETMLDRVRKGEAPLTDDMVDASLVAGDVLKNLLAAAINGVAVVVFVLKGVVVWPAALTMLVGAVAGGVFGARLAQRIPAKVFRVIVIGIGSLLTVWYFLKA